MMPTGPSGRLPFFLLCVATILLAAAPAAFAQSSASPEPADSQYIVAASDEVGAAPPAFVENVGSGTGPVNEAMGDNGSSAAASPPPPEATPPEVSSPPDASPSVGPTVEDLETLPETGGPPFPTLGAGVLLLAAGALLPVTIRPRKAKS